jgi:hypothetical protein
MKKLLVLLVVLAVGAGAVWFGRPAYRNWKQERLLRQARECIARSDFARASLCLRKVVRANPANLEACRTMAQLAETVRSPQAVAWRQRLVELQPQSLQARLDLAYSAMRFRQFALADETLRGVEAPGQRAAAYSQALAALALATNNPALAEAQFAESVQRDPTNTLYQLNLAVFRLGSTNAAAQAQARASLEQMRAHPGLKLQALRSLISHALQAKDFARARALSDELKADAAATFEDRILHLGILHTARSPEREAFSSTLQAEAATNAAHVFALGTWMIANDQAGKAIAWIQSLPPSVQAQQPVPMALADGYLATKDWAGLPKLLQGQDWAGLEPLRLALLSRARSELGDKPAATTNWQAAVQAAQGRLEALTALVNLTTSWGWDAQTEDVLWAITDRHPEEWWTIKTLYQYYLANLNTRGLQRVLTRVVERNPKDIPAKNNLATVSLLLLTDLSRAHELAKEVHATDPANPAFASTYAYSLHLQGRNADALKVLGVLKPEELRAPSIAAYYCVVLAATGDFKLAREYLALAEKGRLLPEEKALLAQTRTVL